MSTAVQQRLRVAVRGAVQGVGFRPFVYHLAGVHRLSGWVRNGPDGVEMEIEGAAGDLARFLVELEARAPRLARIGGVERTVLSPGGASGFSIRASDGDGAPSVLVLPDSATCAACLAEVRDPGDRRYQYPFTNCTHCGPRFSIIRRLPYDRAHTTMAQFVMCPECLREYEDPSDRRFHAQPNACPACGPRLAFGGGSEGAGDVGDGALRAAADAIRRGRIIAVKGLGGFHLVVDAANGEAVRRLRERKLREEKPFALMVGCIEDAHALARVSKVEVRLLTGPEAPIVLVERRPGACVCDEVAPGNPMLGLMLPTTPLHHLLLDAVGGPVVATSGNLSEEPICIGEQEAVDRLGPLADGFLMHDRPIARPIDDSVVRVMQGRARILRRARGYAPLPVRMPVSVDGQVAVGGHLKGAVGLGVGRDLVLGQHVGDLVTPGAIRVHADSLADLQDLYARPAAAAACDLHPDYASTRAAHALGVPVTRVQHHVAHVAGCLAEHGAAPPALGLSWDGTGYGPDGTVWGGECLAVDAEGTWRRAGHFRTFPLPGSEQAVREPWRCGLGLLHAAYGDDIFDDPRYARFLRGEAAVLRPLRRALERGLQCPHTSSLGRVFDAVASLLDLRQVSSYEGQAAMMVEFAAGRAAAPATAYPITLAGGRVRVLDWEPMLDALLSDIDRAVPVDTICARFHETLAEAAVTFAEAAGLEQVALSGGCFQNAILTDRVERALTRRGFRVFLHEQVPPNDGGLAVGQAAVAAAGQKQEW